MIIVFCLQRYENNLVFPLLYINFARKKEKMLRFLLFIALMCNILGSAKTTKADGYILGKPDNEEQIQRYDGFTNHMAEEPQAPIGAALRSMPSSHRVASSRPTRLLPTHGGKPANHAGRWAKAGWSNPLNSLSLLSCGAVGSSRAMAASQRLYYVIALRRLLC